MLAADAYGHLDRTGPPRPDDPAVRAEWRRTIDPTGRIQHLWRVAELVESGALIADGPLTANGEHTSATRIKRA